MTHNVMYAEDAMLMYAIDADAERITSMTLM